MYGIIHYNLGQATLEEFLDYARDTGFTHVELPVSDVWNEKTNEDRAAEVRQAVESRGLKVSALGANNDFIVLEEAQIDYQVNRMRRVCELAQKLGTSVLRTEGGRPKNEVPAEKWVDAMAVCLQRCLEFVVPQGIYLAVDNHGLVTNDGDLQVELFERVGSPHVGANLDTMNYRWAGHSLETIRRFYEKVAPYTLHTHFKDGRGSRNEYVGLALGEGEIELEIALECLRKANYQGVWCVEYEGKTDPREGYRKGLQWLKARLEQS